MNDMQKYGNNVQTIKHVSKVGAIFALVIFIIFFIAGYLHNNLSKNISVLIGIPLIIGSVIPLLVSISAIFNIEMENNVISLLVFGRYRYNSRPTSMISSINIGRGLFSIKFDDGSVIRTLGMYIPEYYRFVHDVRQSTTRKIIVSCDWLSIE